MSSYWTSRIRVAGRKQDIDSVCKIFNPAVEFRKEKHDFEDEFEKWKAWDNVLLPIMRELGAEKYMMNTTDLSGIERLSDEEFAFCADGSDGVSTLALALMEKFPQLYVAYLAEWEGGLEGRYVYDKEERYFKSGYAVNPYSFISYSDYLRSMEKKEEAHKFSLEHEEIDNLVWQLDPNYNLVCHTKEELLQVIGERYGRYLTEEEWNAKGIFFEEVHKDEVTRKKLT